MIDMMVNVIMQIFVMTFWLMWKIVQIGGGLFIGSMRTRSSLRGYSPRKLTDEQFDAAAFTHEAYAIIVPKTQVWDADLALRFVSQLYSMSRVLLQIVAEPSGITFRVTFLDEVYQDTALNTMYSYFPDAQINVVPYAPDDAPVPNTVITIPMVAANIFPAPGMTVDQIKYFDPLIPFTQATSRLNEGERVIYSVAVLADAGGANEAGIKMVTVSDIHPLAYTSLDGIYVAEMRKSMGYDRVPRFEWSVQRMLEGKLNHPLYHVLVLLQVQASTKERAKNIIVDLLSYLMQFANLPYNALVPPEEGNKGAIDVSTLDNPNVHDLYKSMHADVYIMLRAWMDKEEKKKSWKKMLNILQAEEIAALWHPPYEGFTSPAIDWVTAKQAQLPKPLRDNRSGVLIGVNYYGGNQYPVYLPDEDRTAHMAIIGKTGTGKSSLLHQLIHADIQNGRGVCVIDPHGTLTRAILQHSIPVQRARDVVILDVANQVDGVAYPPPFNLLEKPHGVADDIAVGMVMSILAKVYEGFGETQMAHTLHMALLTLSKAEHPTLLEVSRLFEDADFRESLVQQVDHFPVMRFWGSFMSKSPAQQEQMLYPVMRRLDSFYNNNALLAMTCHPKPIDLWLLMQQNKIILVSLAADEAKVPTLERTLMGSVLVAQIQMAAMAGAIIQAPFMIYIDEAQQFVTTSLPTMLSEARKFGLGLVLANQYFKQLVGDTLNAVVGNVGALLAFEVGEPDARALALYMKPEFQPADLVSLGKYRAAVSLRVNQARQPSFSLETLPPPDSLYDELALSREVWLRKSSVARYTPMPYGEVMKGLMQRYTAQSPSAAVNSTAPQAPSAPEPGSPDEFIEPL